MSSFINDLFNGLPISSLLGSRSRNNQYISQPNFSRQVFRLDKHEEWVTINDAEREIYETTPELRLVIDRMARMYANGRWKHLDKNGDEIENSPFVALLENPNILQSRNEYQEQWFIQRSIYPSVFNYQLKGTSFQDVPTALWCLPPSRMSISRTGKIWEQTTIEGIISSYKLKNDDQSSKVFETDEIIQFTFPGSDDPIMGTSALVALRMPISNIRAAYGYRNVILTKKGAIGLWSNEAKDQMGGTVPLTPAEDKKMSEQLTTTYGIGDDQAKVAISSKPLKWTPSTYPTKDLMLFEEIEADMKRIIDMFGANDNMFSRDKASTFNNVEAGNLKAYQDTLIPVGQDQANGYAKRWGLLDKGESLEYCFDHLPEFKENESERSVTAKTEAETIEILVNNGMSFEDAAERIGWDVTGKTIGAPLATQSQGPATEQ